MTSDNSILIIIAIGIAAFFIFRELVCWYFKINKQVELMKMMLQTMLKIYEKEGGDVNWDAVKKQMNM